MNQLKTGTNSEQIPKLKTFSLEEHVQNSINSFKEEIMNSVRDMEARMKTSQNSLQEDLNSRLFQYDKIFNEFSIKINDINTIANLDKMKLNKIDDLSVFQKKASDQFISFDVKFNALQKDFTNSCYKYDKIYLDNLIVPGTIGDFAQFKNMREYVEYSFSHTTSLISFKEKQMADWKSYKEKLDLMIKNVSSQLDTHDKNLKTYTNKMLEVTEANLSKEITDLNSKLNEVKIENHKHALNLQKSANDLTVEYNKILEIKSDITKHMEESVNKMMDSHKITVESFDTVKNEFETIKKKFLELAEFIKDVRFRKNIGVDVNRQEFKNMAGQLINKDSRKSPEKFKRLNTLNHMYNQYNFNDEKDHEIESYVKNYILSGSLKSFDNEKKEKTEKNPNRNIQKKRNTMKEKEIITPEKFKLKEKFKLQNESIDESSSDEIEDTLLKDKNDIHSLTKKNSKDESNTSDNKLNNPNDIIFKKSSNKRKFKDKFPISQGRELKTDLKDHINKKERSVSNEIEINTHNLRQTEKEDSAVKTNPDINIFNDKSTENLKNLKIFNENFLIFKSDFMNKFSDTEKKLIDIENFSKKKLEDLENKIKNLNINNYNQDSDHNEYADPNPSSRNNYKQSHENIIDLDKITSKNTQNSIYTKFSNKQLINYSEGKTNSKDINFKNINNHFDKFNRTEVSNSNLSSNIPSIISKNLSNINRTDEINPSEGEKNYIVNIINPNLFTKNNQNLISKKSGEDKSSTPIVIPSAINIESRNEHSTQYNPNYIINNNRSKSRKTIKTTSKLKINDMYLQYGNKQNENVIDNKTSIPSNIQRELSGKEKINKAMKNDKYKSQRHSTPISEFAFENVKNVFMPYTSILNHNSKMDQIES